MASSSYRRSGLFAILVLIVLLVAVVLTWEQIQSQFRVRAIPVEWQERFATSSPFEVTLAGQIENEIGQELASVMGLPPWAIDLNRLTLNLQKVPWVEAVQVARSLPDRLIVSFRPKNPVAIILSSDGRRWVPVTDKAQIMPDWTSDVVPSLMLLRGDGFLKNDKQRNLAVQLVKTLTEVNDRIWEKSNLAEISYTDKSGFQIQLISPRTEVLLGMNVNETEVLKSQLRRTSAVLNYLTTHNRHARIIDSTSVKKIVVRAQPGT